MSGVRTRKLLMAALLASSATALAPVDISAKAQDSTSLPRIEEAECVTDVLANVNAKCYTFFAEEDRDDPSGTVVELPVAVITPKTASEGAEPVFFFPGGPGSSRLSSEEEIQSLLADTPDNPLVVFDPRGFVHAKPALRCPDYSAFSPYFNTLSPVIISTTDTEERLRMHADAIERCYEKLFAEGVDIPKYNDYEIARDVEEIRTLLGYDRINIYGISAGSGSALQYLRYYPDNVRAMILGWPWFGAFRDRAAIDEYYTQKQMFTDVLELCVSTDPECRELLPAWYHAIDRARRTLDAKPFVKIVQDENGEEQTLYFDGVALMNRIYMYSASIYDKLPNVVARIQKGDYSALDDFFGTSDWGDLWNPAHWAKGAYLALICNDMGTNRPTKEDTRSMVEREPAVLGYEDNKMCAWWGSDGDVPPEHRFPVVSDVPTLTLHGQVDACCGTRWGHYVAETIPNTQIVEFQAQGHADESQCRHKVISAFLKEPSTEVDDSCRDEVPLRPWVLE